MFSEASSKQFCAYCILDCMGMHFVHGTDPERQKILLFKHTIMNYSSLKNQVHTACVYNQRKINSEPVSNL